jgi:glycosyltransferase involved in cell wall biosynthesis
MSQEEYSQNDKIKFSVCIPNYNYENYIGKTIQSVLDQCYKNFEIIIADNASTDNSIKVVRSYKDDRIIIIENNYNIGFAPNLDKATENASGDYLILLSSDDLMSLGTLKTLAKNIQKYNGLQNPLVLTSSINIIDEKGQVKSNRYALHDQIVNGLKKEEIFQNSNISVYDGQTLLKHALSNDFVIVGRFLSTCFSKKLFELVEGYNSITSIMPDVQFSHKLMLLNPKTIVIGDELFSYRIHSTNNYSAIFSHIKLAWDAYTFTNLYTDLQLKPMGLNKLKLRWNFVNYWGNQSLLNNAFSGRISYSFKLWLLIWAVYPKLYRNKIMAWIFPFFIPSLVLIKLIFHNEAFLSIISKVKKYRKN